MDLINNDDLDVKAILRSAVAEALERKQRLGQYAVIWQDGKPVFVGGEHDSALAGQAHSKLADSTHPS